jgi:hypothetical protein
MTAMLVGFCLSVGTSGQSAETQRKTNSSPQAAEITRFFVEEPKKDSGYETGPLHIIYDDGTEIVKALPPLKASTEKEIVYNAVGFSGVQLAEDRRTLGWTIDVEDCCTSYAIPMGLIVFRNKHVLHTFYPGLEVWEWMFVQRGVRVAVVSGPTHGTDVGDHRLYDVRTGKLISEAYR